MRRWICLLIVPGILLLGNSCTACKSEQHTRKFTVSPDLWAGQEGLKKKADANPLFYKSGIGIVESKVFIKRKDEFNALYLNKSPYESILLYKGNSRGSSPSEIIEISGEGEKVHVRELASIPSQSSNIIIVYAKDAVYVLNFGDGRFGHYMTRDL